MAIATAPSKADCRNCIATSFFVVDERFCRAAAEARDGDAEFRAASGFSVRRSLTAPVVIAHGLIPLSRKTGVTPERQAGRGGTKRRAFCTLRLTTWAEQRLSSRVLFRTPVGYATGGRAVTSSCRELLGQIGIHGSVPRRR
jgi:hypothetical protein